MLVTSEWSSAVTVGELKVVGEAVGSGIGAVVIALARGSALVTSGRSLAATPVARGRLGFALKRSAPSLKVFEYLGASATFLALLNLRAVATVVRSVALRVLGFV